MYWFGLVCHSLLGCRCWIGYFALELVVRVVVVADCGLVGGFLGLRLFCVWVCVTLWILFGGWLCRSLWFCGYGGFCCLWLVGWCFLLWCCLRFVLC